MVYLRGMKIALILSLFGLFTVTPSIPTADAARTTVREERSLYKTSISTPTKPASNPQPTQPTVQPQPVTQPTTQPAVQPQATQPANFVSAVEAEVFSLINQERAKAGLAALKTDTKLASVARAHSADMAKNNYFSHTNQQGCSSSCRVTNAGYAWRAVGENIYMMKGYTLNAKDTAAMMVKGWMNSSGHRANILNKTYTHHGVGVAQVGSSIYATDDFALPR